MRSLLSAVVIGAGCWILGAASAPAGELRVPARVVVRPSVLVVVPQPGDHFGIARVLRAAERGNARAQLQLGFMHEYGRGVPQDYITAALWYRRAAEQGNPVAQHLLGLMYNKGFGVPVDYIEAHKWLNLAAGAADPERRDYYIRMRNALTSKMDRPEIDAAQRRARVWAPKPEW